MDKYDEAIEKIAQRNNSKYPLKEVWNEAIEAAAQKVNEEMGADETDAYYLERAIRELKK